MGNKKDHPSGVKATEEDIRGDLGEMIAQAEHIIFSDPNWSQLRGRLMASRYYFIDLEALLLPYAQDDVVIAAVVVALQKGADERRALAYLIKALLARTRSLEAAIENAPYRSYEVVCHGGDECPMKNIAPQSRGD